MRPNLLRLPAAWNTLNIAGVRPEGPGPLHGRALAPPSPKKTAPKRALEPGRGR